MSINESKQSVAGIETFYLHAGQGPPIVFLHGVPSFSYLWRHVISQLGKDFSCYAPDLPGYASSANPRSFSLKEYAEWLRAFSDSITKDGKINLVLHDVGGPVGLSFVLQYPQKINRLVIMDTVFSSKDLNLLMKIIINPAVVWAYLNLTNKTIFRWIIKQTVYQKNKVHEEAIDRYYQVFLRDKKEGTTEKVFKLLKTELEETVGNKISQITCPSLILWAEKDFALPLSIAAKITAKIKNSTLKTLPNCGHFSQEEEPKLIADAINEFLRSEKSL